MINKWRAPDFSADREFFVVVDMVLFIVIFGVVEVVMEVSVIAAVAAFCVIVDLSRTWQKNYLWHKAHCKL